MRKIIPPLFLFVAFSFSNEIYGQTCFGSFAGPDISLSCGTNCTPFTAQIPEIRSTEAYTVGSIPYNPYPYVTAAPLMTYPGCANQDDKFYPTTNLPFNFCFYGTTYSLAIIGTNGVISFDIGDDRKGNNYVIQNPIPFIGAGGLDASTCPAPGGSRYPKPAIFGLFHDIFPENIPLPPGTPANYKIESRVEGISPCRRFVVSFNNVKMYDCQSSRVTFQIVIYESTNIAEVYVEDKPVCGGSNSNPIIGLQRTGTAPDFISPPGRNLFSNAISNEAWQFKPDGATSLLDHVELLLNGVFVTNGTIGALNNGFYDIDFGNVCPPNQNNTYTVRGVYKTCNNDPTFFNIDDDVDINRIIPFYTNGSITKSILCNGDATAEVTFNPIGNTNPYQFSKNAGVTYQNSGVFSNLTAGPKSFRIKDVNGCTKDTVINIPEPTTLTLTAIQTQPSNCSNKTGILTLTAGGGTPAYQYSIDGGVTYVPSNVFSNLSVGTYSGLQIKDANNCIKTYIPVSITLLDTMRLELGPDSTICVGQKVLMLTQTNAETDTFKWTPTKPLLDYDTARTPIFSPVDTTKYTVVAKWGLCSRTDNITINVKHKPVPEAGKDTTVCYKTIAYLKGSATNLSGSVNYAWAPPGLVIPNNAANAVAYPDTTRYFYLTVTDNYGCNFSVVDSVKITMRDQVPAFAGNDTIAMYNKPHQLEATGGLGFVWSPATPLNNPFVRSPLAILKHDQYFEVKVTDDIGCYAIDGVFIRAIEGPTYHLPNAFSPNGDGTNETFTPIPSGITTTDYFRIFDRYGVLMFQTKEWLKGWNGNFNGKPALAGTYVWMIKGTDVGGSVVEQKGTVILIR
jgi:gliding motility-associated-like protein